MDEGARLESECAATYRGFESRSLHHFFDPCYVISVSCVDVEEGDGRVFSTEDIEPRQAWKGATVV